MAENKIVINGDVYTDSEIISGNAFLSNSLACDELTIDTLDTSVTNTRLIGTLLRDKDGKRLISSDSKVLYALPMVRVQTTNPNSYKYGTPAYYYHGENLVGKFYVSDTQRTGKNVYTVSCVSAIGLLDSVQHYGGMYTGQSFSTVLEDIIGGFLPYSVSDDLKDQRVYNWLPIDTKRNNLHQLLFAMGASVFKDENGDMLIAPLGTNAPEELDANKIYLEGSVSQDKKVSRVVVVEHSYAAYDTDEEIVLYEDAVVANPLTTPKGDQTQGVLVRFDGPMHDLSIESGEIIERGVNYAVIGPSPTCRLIGKAYTHTTRQVIREDDVSAQSASVQIQDNDAIVENATLVSVANSENVADRVMNYYSSTKKVKAGIVKQENDKPGMRVSFNDTFGDPVTGYVKSMDITMSGILKADSEVVVGYTPTAVGNNYNKYNVISLFEDDWTVPPKVTKIRVVLIGGGDGGEVGENGEDGFSSGSGGKGGAGGAGGAAGLGGKVLILDLSVTQGQVFHIKTGNGGSGGKYDPETGKHIFATEGTATTFGEYSSNNGERSNFGFKQMFSGQVFAIPGKNGHAGGKGRDAGDTSERQPLEPDYVAYPGETGRFRVYADVSAEGGGGGGASYVSGNSYGRDGGNGNDAWLGTGTNGKSILHGGKGGDGASGGQTWYLTTRDADTANNAIIVQAGSGRGGYGGNGGGGGGGGGGKSSGDNSVSVMGADGGIGGNGSDGSDGMRGCAIIYY